MVENIAQIALKPPNWSQISFFIEFDVGDTKNQLGLNIIYFHYFSKEITDAQNQKQSSPQIISSQNSLLIVRLRSDLLNR